MIVRCADDQDVIEVVRAAAERDDVGVGKDVDVLTETVIRRPVTDVAA